MWELRRQLVDLEARGLRRQRRIVAGPQGPHLEVEGQRYLSFAANDYLALANHPALVEAAKRGAEAYGVGAAASPLLCGHTSAHEALEARLAAFVRMPRALYFTSGYLANLGTVAALVDRGGTVFSDTLNHACLIDAARLSRADIRVYPHGDVEELARMLAESETPMKLVMSDAVFSMDGDLAPVPDLVALCDRHDAWLLLDDAHGFGVLGESGRGTLAHFGVASPRIIYMATLGKAAGVSGAFVAGPGELVEWLLQRARTYIYSTAAPPMLATALLASLDLIEREEWRRERLRAWVARLREGLAGDPGLTASQTAIQPLIVGDNQPALALMEGLRDRGMWVPAIRPPTVPAGTARLRISLSAGHTEEDVDRLVGALRELR